jgi:LAO/AO transport system kinase
MSAPRPRPRTPEEVVAGVLADDRRAVARAISWLENGAPEGAAVVARLWPHTGRAATVGVTGPPGVGKSSLLAALVAHLRAAGRTVGVVSVDPSSPFTRGALLGDRIRLADHFLDPGVFIRSMGTRGHLGGVAETTFLAVSVLDAAGKDVVLVETVGVGQSEIEVASLVDVVVLTLQPGSGDSVQALKAGVMEIPDVLCVNKRDHPQASAMRVELRHALSLAAPEDRPPVVETDALSGAGVEELWRTVEARREALLDDLPTRRRVRLEQELRTIAVARAATRIATALDGDPDLRATLERLHERELDPVAAVEQLLEAAFGAADR